MPGTGLVIQSVTMKSQVPIHTYVDKRSQPFRRLYDIKWGWEPWGKRQVEGMEKGQLQMKVGVGVGSGHAFNRVSLVVQMVQNLPAMQETQVQSLGREDQLEKEMATHSSILAWRIPWTEELVDSSPWDRSSAQFSRSVVSDSAVNHSMPGLPVHHQLQEFTQTHVHWVGDAIEPSRPLWSPSPPALNLSQHQGLDPHPTPLSPPPHSAHYTGRLSSSDPSGSSPHLQLPEGSSPNILAPQRPARKDTRPWLSYPLVQVSKWPGTARHSPLVSPSPKWPVVSETSLAHCCVLVTASGARVDIWSMFVEQMNGKQKPGVAKLYSKNTEAQKEDKLASNDQRKLGYWGSWTWRK